LLQNRHAIIFDLGGVLLRTEDYQPRHKWDRRLGLSPGSVEAVVHGSHFWREAQTGIISIEAYWNGVGKELRLNPWEISDFQQDFYAGDRFDMSLIRLIKSLRRKKIGIGLLSNNTLDVLDHLTLVKIRSLFDICVISAEIGVMKPDPAAYQAILDRFQIPAATTLFIDDSLENVTGARRCGMGSIQFFPRMDLEADIQAWLSGPVRAD
jgi:HAD superfamily hydrolase (TIGR01509 family)